jgi:hypothetical protein
MPYTTGQALKGLQDHLRDAGSQRKAVRAALPAGLAPDQIAKHFQIAKRFGLSAAAVRKVPDETP